MRRLKLLQFPIASSQGGITQYVLNNWKHIDKERFQFDFATMSKSLPMQEELVLQGCKVFKISCYAEENEEQFIKEFKKILLGGYDVIHLHTKQWKSFCVEQVAKECGIKKIVIHSHSTGIDTQDIKKKEWETIQHYRLRNKVSKDLGTDFWACSWLAADFLFGSNIPKSDIRILKNGIDVSRFIYNKAVRDKIRKDLNLEDNYIIGHVGRFTYSKNHEFLIELFSHVVAEQSSARLLLVGSGELENFIKSKIEMLNLSDKVIFLGQRLDVNELYQAMDIFTLPSRFEGLSMALIEAQAAGLRCVASDNVPDEAVISNNLKKIPLDISMWKSQVLQWSAGYYRKDMYNEITQKGYNINTEIKKVEKLYSQFD